MLKTRLILGMLVAAVTISPCELAGQQQGGASAVPLIPREALFGNPERSQGRISPDGRFLSWLAPSSGVMNVWVGPTGQPGSATAVTSDTLRGINFYIWAPDSKHVLYLQDEGGREDFHVYAVDVATARVRDLTPLPPGARASLQGVNSHRPDVASIGLNDRDPELFDLYEVDYRTGARKLVARNPGVAEWLLDGTLRPRLGFEQRPGGGGTYYHLQPDGTKGHAFLDIPSDDYFGSYLLGFSEQGDTVYAMDSRGRDKTALVAMDISTGGSRVVAASEEAEITEILRHPTTGRPLAYSVEYLTPRWYPADSSVAADIALLEQRLSGGFSLTSTTDDNAKWIISHDAAESPAKFYLYDRPKRTLSPLFTTRPRLEGEPLQPMHALVIRARDGLELVSYLTLPPGSDADGDGRPESTQPLVLMVHGGPWSRDVYGYNGPHQWLANRGYAVLSVNFRGSIGFGKRHLNSAVGEWSGKMHDDLIDAVDWAVAEGITRRNSVAIFGGSYGGYATLVGLTFTPDRFACGVDIVGPSNLITLMESFPPYWRPSIESTFYRHVGDPARPEDRARMAAQSPITRASRIRVPLLIGHGENDPRVTKAESDQLVAAMTANGLPVTYINYTDEGHGFQRPVNRLSFFAAMEGFLATCLGGRAEPIGDAFAGSSAEVLAGAQFIPGLGSAEDQQKSRD